MRTIREKTGPLRPATTGATRSGFAGGEARPRFKLTLLGNARSAGTNFLPTPQLVVRTSPSIVPGGEKDIYLVLDDFGRLGRALRETDEAGTNRATLVRNLLDGQYENPVRIVAFKICSH